MLIRINELEIENKKLKSRIRYEDSVIYYANKYVNFLHETLINYIIKSDIDITIKLDNEYKKKYITEYKIFLENINNLKCTVTSDRRCL